MYELNDDIYTNGRKYTVDTIKELSETFGYGETSTAKMFKIPTLKARNIVKGINKKDTKYEKTHRELNTNELPYATHFLDITFPFHDGSIRHRSHARSVLTSIDGYTLVEVGLRKRKDMTKQRKRFKVPVNDKEGFSIDYSTLLNVLVSFDVPKGSKIVFDRYYKQLKKLEEYGITPIVCSKTHRQLKWIKGKFEEVQRVYNSEVESMFGNVAKRIYKSLDLWTVLVKVKKRWKRKAILTIDEMEKLHEALCEVEDNHNPEKIVQMMEFLKIVKKKRKVKTKEIVIN